MEYHLVSHCAPTLAGKKIANLFTFKHVPGKSIHKQVNYWNEKLNVMGISIKVLKSSRIGSLVLVYRIDKLKLILEDVEVADFLHSMGYDNADINYVLKKIMYNLNKSNSFPHEIGLLLGYPLKDVKGFIENKGRCYKLSGFWKVYGDSLEADKLFREYNHCRNCFISLYYQGMSALEIMKKFKGGYVQ